MPRPLIIAMKGHPGSGKSTLARRISASLRCPLLDKDDVRDHTLPLQQTLMVPPALLNDLAYAVLFRLAESQLASAGLPAVVVDSPLSSRGHLDRLLEVARRVGGGVAVAVVECRPGDEDEWRRRLEERGRWTEEEGEKRGWHKPKTWEELRRLVDGYGGRTDYDVGGVPRLVVDTTAPMTDGKDGSDEMMSEIMEFIRSIRDVETELKAAKFNIANLYHLSEFITKGVFKHLAPSACWLTPSG